MSAARRTRYSGTMRGFDSALLEKLSAMVQGSAADRMRGLAAYCSGRNTEEAAETAGMDLETFKKFMGDFRDMGIPALYTFDSATCLPMPARYSEASLRRHLKNAETSRETNRITAAIHAYSGMTLDEIAEVMTMTAPHVRALIEEFVLYGPTGCVFPSPPRPRGDVDAIRRLSEVEPDKWVRRQAAMFADWLEDDDVVEISARHEVRLTTLVKALRRIHVLGMEGLYHAKARTPVKTKAGGRSETRKERGKYTLDRDTLIRQSRGVKDRQRVIRLNALSMVADGKSCGEAGRFYDVSGHDVRRWRSAYLTHGLRGI